MNCSKLSIEYKCNSKEMQSSSIMFSMETFGGWLLNQLKQRDWTQADLAKRSGLSPGSISNIINGAKGLGMDSLNALAGALNVSVETVFRAAQGKPPHSENSEQLDNALHILSMLDKEELEEILQIARLKLNRKQSKQKSGRGKPARTLLNDTLER